MVICTKTTEYIDRKAKSLPLATKQEEECGNINHVDYLLIIIRNIGVILILRNIIITSCKFIHSNTFTGTNHVSYK